jgi:nucleoside 2-deoxyribosyltransferase
MTDSLKWTVVNGYPYWLTNPVRNRQDLTEDDWKHLLATPHHTSQTDTWIHLNGGTPRPQTLPSSPVADPPPSLAMTPKTYPMKIYLAGSWSRKHELQGYRKVLERLGFTVTSRWLDEEDGPHSVYTPDNHYYHQLNAQRDISDISRSDLVICFTSTDPTVPVIGGGRHYEMGYADALWKKLIYVGAREHVFHYLFDATVLDTAHDLYLWLLDYPNTHELDDRLASAGTWATE